MCCWIWVLYSDRYNFVIFFCLYRMNRVCGSFVFIYSHQLDQQFFCLFFCRSWFSKVRLSFCLYDRVVYSLSMKKNSGSSGLLFCDIFICELGFSTFFIATIYIFKVENDMVSTFFLMQKILEYIFKRVKQFRASRRSM